MCVHVCVCVCVCVCICVYSWCPSKSMCFAGSTSTPAHIQTCPDPTHARITHTQFCHTSNTHTSHTHTNTYTQWNSQWLWISTLLALLAFVVVFVLVFGHKCLMIDKHKGEKLTGVYVVCVCVMCDVCVCVCVRVYVCVCVCVCCVVCGGNINQSFVC